MGKDMNSIKRRQRANLATKKRPIINRDITDEEMSDEWYRLTKSLNHRQVLFCEKYIETRDVGLSYKTAYPENKPKSAKASGYRLMGKKEIVDYINYLIREYGPVPRLSMNEIMAELERVAMSDDINSSNKLKALTLLGQAHGELIDKVEVTTKEFVIDIIDDED